MWVEINLSQQPLFGVNAAKQYFTGSEDGLARTFRALCLFKRSNHGCFFTEWGNVTTTHTTECSPPLSYHLGVIALTDGFTNCTKYAKIKEHYSHIHFQALVFSLCTTLLFSWHLCKGSRRKHCQEDWLLVILQNIMDWRHLSVIVDFFCLLFLYSTYANVFNHSCGVKLFTTFPLYFS